MSLYFRPYGKLNSFKIRVNRGSSSTNSCDNKLTSTVVVPHKYLNFVPESITEEIYREASKLLNEKSRIAAGPDGSNIYYCHNNKNIRMPVLVEHDTRVNWKVVTCLSKSCVRYRSFNVYCHTVAVVKKLNVLSTLISKLNAKLTTEQTLWNSANVSRDKNCGKIKQRQLKREKDHRKSEKIAKLLPDRGELELPQQPSTSQRHANIVSTKPDI